MKYENSLIIEYAENLLDSFIVQFCNIFGEDYITYNVHSLIHLSDDARKFGSLDSVSAFKFESFLG